MAQFDICRNKHLATKAEFPYLLDIQHDLFAGMPTRLVIPLIKQQNQLPPTVRLNPIVTIKDQRYVVLTQQMFGIAAVMLGERVGNAAVLRDEIIAALDFLVIGF